MATTWNPADKTANITLSNGNLTATNGAAAGNTVRATSGLGSGKWFFEVTMSVWLGANSGPGVALSTAPMPWFNNTPGVAYVDGFGNIRINGATSGSALGTPGSGDIIACAVDLTASLIW